MRWIEPYWRERRAFKVQQLMNRMSAAGEPMRYDELTNMVERLAWGNDLSIGTTLSTLIDEWGQRRATRRRNKTMADLFNKLED